MPARCRNSKFLFSKKKFLIPNSKCLRPAFSLIEIIIVITLFAITSIAVTTSYVSFEQREKLKNAALQIKTDLRLAQSRAQSGDKSLGGCSTANSLVGWYVTFDTAANTSYQITGDCLSISGSDETETSFGSETIKLPEGVTISGINVDGSTTSSTHILFRPLEFKISFHSSGALTCTSPCLGNIDFVNGSAMANEIAATATEAVITLSNDDGSYEVRINSSGQVREVML